MVDPAVIDGGTIDYQKAQTPTLSAHSRRGSVSGGNVNPEIANVRDRGIPDGVSAIRGSDGTEIGEAEAAEKESATSNRGSIHGKDVKHEITEKVSAAGKSDRTDGTEMAEPEIAAERPEAKSADEGSVSGGSGKKEIAKKENSQNGVSIPHMHRIGNMFATLWDNWRYVLPAAWVCNTI